MITMILNDKVKRAFKLTVFDATKNKLENEKTIPATTNLKSFAPCPYLNLFIFDF